MKTVRKFLRLFNPYVFSLIKDKELYKDIGIADKRKIEFICPRCGAIVKQVVGSAHKHGLSCKKCGDGISFGEKFVFNVLEQLHIIFDTHVSFAWSNKRIYDVGIYENDQITYLLEVQGKQHYEGGFESYGSRDYKAEVENDIYKKSLAFANSFNEQTYFEVDCRISSYEYIKNSILTNKFFQHYDLSCIDWQECCRNAISSYAIKAQKMWNDGAKIETIASTLRLNRCTIRGYLKRGAEIGMCTYSVKNSFHRRRAGTFIPAKSTTMVVCHQIKSVFISLAEAERQTGIQDSSISQNIKGIYTHAGKTENGENMIWNRITQEELNLLVQNQGYTLFGTKLTSRKARDEL